MFFIKSESNWPMVSENMFEILMAIQFQGH